MKIDGEKKRLRPVVYTSSFFKRGAQNTAQQIFLLKALQVTRDPGKLRDMIGVKSVADVYRTLDKLAMRREYHEALSRAGISFDYIVDGIKNIADKGHKDVDRLKAFQVLLKSVGMESYDETAANTGGNWEEVLMKKVEEQKKAQQEGNQLVSASSVMYDVKIPEVPESARVAQEEEDEMISNIYDSK